MSKRKCFSLAEKAEIVEKSKEFHGTKVDLAKSLGIAYSTLQTILKQETSVELSADKLGKFAKKRKTLKTSPYDDLENILMQWFKAARASKIPINGSVVKEKALEIAERLKLQGFSASNGWIDRFKKRNNLCFKSICGESEGVDIATVQQWKENTLPNLLRDYIPRDVFNADETGLFFNLLPDKTLTVKGENCHGGKLSKQRLTVLLCTNADGSEKLTPLVIGKAKKPRCFKNVKSLPTDYVSNKKSWMTQSLFEDFLRKLDKKMRLQKRKIILFLDNCSAHLELQLKNVRVEFLPSNSTSQLQPLDLGIIRSFKSHYRKQLVRKSLLFIDSGDLHDASTAKINVLEALNLISAAWDSVDKNCIINVFNKAGFSASNNEISPSPSDDNEMEKDCVAEGGHLPEVDDEYIDCDAHLITSQVLPISDLMPASDDSGDEDEEEIAEDVVPTADQAFQSIQTLKRFLASNVNQEANLQKIVSVERAVVEIVSKSKKQVKITHFFH